MNGSLMAVDNGAPKTLAERIANAREATGFTTPELAHRLGVRTSTLASWESGEGEPRANRLIMLAGLMSVSPTWLLCGRGTAPHEHADPNITSLRTSLSELRSMLSAVGEHVQHLQDRFEDLNRSANTSDGPLAGRKPRCRKLMRPLRDR